MIRFFLSLLLVLAGSLAALPQKRVALIVKYGTDTETAVRFDFDRGKFILKRILFSTGLGTNGWIEKRIVKGRYLFSNNRVDPKEELTFDLLSNMVVGNAIRSKLFPRIDKNELSILRSPDKEAWVEQHLGIGPLSELVIYRKNDAAVKVAGPFRASVSEISSILPFLPMLWIDNDRLLVQRRNGSLVLISRDGTSIDLPEMPCTSDDFPQLFRTRQGHLIYRCGHDFLLNIEKRSFKQIRFDLDFGFSSDGTPSTLYHDGLPIGADGFDPVVNANYIAVTQGKSRYGMTDSSTIDTIRVWNTFTTKWQTFKLDGGSVELIGWYEY